MFKSVRVGVVHKCVSVCVCVSAYVCVCACEGILSYTLKHRMPLIHLQGEYPVHLGPRRDSVSQDVDIVALAQQVQHCLLDTHLGLEEGGVRAGSTLYPSNKYRRLTLYSIPTSLNMCLNRQLT